MKKLVLSLVLAGFALLSLTACIDISLQPQVVTRGVTGLYTVELWSDHEYYDMGEPVHLRLTLTNVSTNTVAFGSGSNTTPVLDLRVAGGNTNEWWSEGNPDEVRYNVVLRPSGSYMITWTLTLPLKGDYGVGAWWIDPREGERFSIPTGFLYGERLPSP